jgi:hypothetical protein
MKNQKTFNELAKNFQPLEQTHEGMLKGGYASLEADMDVIDVGEVNGIACKDQTNTNCAGANCVAGCGG